MTDIPTTVKNKELVEKRREQIVLAAITLFSKKGFYKTTLRELAEEAGLSTGNIYDYVGSKEDIFYLIHDFAADLAVEALDRSVRDITDPMEKLRRMVRAEFNLMDQWADAIMLIYQESHILNPPFLHRLLQREREHLRKFEEVIEECIEANLLRECNVRMTANLIKSMVDTWVIKRWDLRGHATQLEAETSILDLVFNGLIPESSTSLPLRTGIDDLSGRTAFVVNDHNVIGSSICATLLKKGVKVIAYGKDDQTSNEFAIDDLNEHENYIHYSSSEIGRLTPTIVDQIESQNGPVDLYIHDLGVGYIGRKLNSLEMEQLAQQLVDNLNCALTIAPHLISTMDSGMSGRIIFLAPWGWDQYVDQIRFRAVVGALKNLCQGLVRKRARSRLTVNCVVPGFLRTVRPSPLERQMAVELETKIPLGRLGEISDLTDVICFLASAASEYITGQTLTVAGGANELIHEVSD